MGGSFGHGGSDLCFFDLLFVFIQGWRKIEALAGGKGDRSVPEPERFGRLGILHHEFLIKLEGFLGLVVAAVELGEFHEEAKTVAGFTFPDQIEGLFVQFGGVLLFVEVLIDVGSAFQDDFIFGEVFHEFGHGGFGLGEGAGVGQETDLAEAEPGEVGRVDGLGGIQVLVEVAGKGAIQGISDKGDHPGE